MAVTKILNKVLLSVFTIFAALSFPVLALDDKDSDNAGRKTPSAVPMLRSEIRIDGALDEDAWDDALVIELKYETSPGENVDPPVRTEVLITHSGSHIYVGFRAYDPDPNAIRAHLRDRDSIWGDDSVSVTFDTFNDERRAFRFECNPLGVQSDSLVNEGRRGHRWGGSSWDAIWNSAGQITNWGYSVEMAIPFNMLRFPRINGDQTWGFFASRKYPRSVTHSFRNVPNERGRNCDLCQAAKIKGFAGIAPGRNIEFTPTTTAIRSEEREDLPAGPMEVQSSIAEAGLSGRWGVTSNISLTGALNPDFSQIEADAVQLDINRRFTRRYPEKRPFFLEGEEYFRGIHTRNITDPIWGLKVTGKEGANSIGLLVARDEVTSLIFPASTYSSSTSLDIDSTAASIRYMRDIWNNSTIGLTLNNREGKDYYNRVVGIDGNLYLSSNDSVSFTFAGSGTRYDAATTEEYEQPEDSFSDREIDLSYRRSTRNWSAFASYRDVGEKFRVDLNHLTKVGYRSYHFHGERRWYGDRDSFFTRISVSLGASQNEEQDGDLLNRHLSANTRISGPMQTHLNYRFSRSRSNFDDLTFVRNDHSIHGGFRPLADLRLSFNLGAGDAIDFSQMREARRISFGPEANLYWGRHLNLNIEHDFTRLTVEGGRLYMTNVTEGRIIYQFNSRTFLRAILQYVDIRRNATLYDYDEDDEVNPITRTFFSQLLFSYKLNPRTVLFIGYSDNYRGTQDFDIVQTNRAFFVKLGYAWVL